MVRARVISAVGAILLLAGGGLAVASADAAEGKQPPACAAISFRPLLPGAPDGEQDAGLYKSRFVKIEIKATVKGGLPETYYMMINGARPAPLAGGVPKGSEGCLKSKHVAVPVKTQGATCTGTRFRVVIERSGASKVALFFGLQGNDWALCSAAKL
jgi:hypothetical protein